MFCRTVTLSVLLSAMLFSSASAQNLLLNPSFEDVPNSTQDQGILPDNWIQASSIVPGADTWSVDGSYGLTPGDFSRFTGIVAQDGNRWAAGGANPAYIEAFGQALAAPLSPFATYEFTAYMQQDISLSNAPGGYDVYLSPTAAFDDPEAVRVARVPATTGASWEARKVVFNVPFCAEMFPYFVLAPYCIRQDAEAYPGIDNVSLTAVTDFADVSGTVTLLDCNDPEQAITFEFRPKNGDMTFKYKQMLIQTARTAEPSNFPAFRSEPMMSRSKGIAGFRP